MSTNSRNKYFVKNTIIFAIGNFGTKLINFFMVPLYTYVLSTSEYGEINNILSVCGILIPLVLCNISESVRRYLLDKNSDKSKIQSVELIWFGIGSLISLLLYFILTFVPYYSNYAMEMSLYVFSNALVTVCLEYLRGEEKFVLYTIFSLIQTVLIASLNVLFLVHFHYGIEGYYWSYIISYFVVAVLAFVIGNQVKTLKKLKFDKALFKEMSIFSLTLVPNSLMWWITNASDKLMITHFVSAAANGIYSVAAKLPTMISTFNTILMQAWQISAIKESDSEDKVEYNNKMFKLYMSTTAIVCAGLLLINRPFLSIYVAPEFYEAWKYSPILIVSSSFSTLATFVGTSYYVEKDAKGNLLSATSGAVINLILNLIMIPILGVTGAAIATCVSHFVVFVYRIVDTKKYLPLKVVTPYSIKLFITIMAMLIFSLIPHWTSYIFMAICLVVIAFITKDYLFQIIKNVLMKMKIKK